VPVARFLGRRNYTLAIIPWLIVSAISGWQSFKTPCSSSDYAEEQQLIDHLRSSNIRVAAADYWLAYRLTFLSGENPIVVPLDPKEDRYKPYRQQFLRAPQTALIFHPLWSRNSREAVEEQLQNQSAGPPETIGRFTIVRVSPR
jgi:hypothetical protein